MDNRSKLRESGVVLIIFGILNLFIFATTIVDSFIDGSLAEGLATVDADILVAVKVVLIVLGAIMALLVVADVFLGIKAINVSKKPNANKGYITLGKVFLVMSCIAAISHMVTVFGGNASVDAGVNLANAALNIAVYCMFIQSAEAVRKDVLNAAK